MRQLKITKQITNRDTKSLEKYFQEISKIDLITADEEVELARRIREGDQIALNKLVNANLRFVVSAAKQYQGSGLRLSDLINEGNIGLVKAAKRFDETRGFKFISYAVWWIRQSILQAISQQSRLVRLPLNKVDVVTKMRKIYQELEKEFDREPTTAEIAEAMELSKSEIEDTIMAAAKELSMDGISGDEDEASLLDVLPSTNVIDPEDSLNEESLHMEVDRALSLLSKREAD